jgi:hypothetical protein
MSDVTAITFYNLTNLVENHGCRQKSFRLDQRGNRSATCKLLKTIIWSNST